MFHTQGFKMDDIKELLQEGRRLLEGKDKSVNIGQIFKIKKLKNKIIIAQPKILDKLDNNLDKNQLKKTRKESAIWAYEMNKMNTEIPKAHRRLLNSDMEDYKTIIYSRYGLVNASFTRKLESNNQIIKHKFNIKDLKYNNKR